MTVTIDGKAVAERGRAQVAAEAMRSLCALVVPADRAGGTSPPALCE